MLAGIEKQTKRAYRLTTALPPDRDDLMKRMTEIADTLDGINIMLYDFAGGWSSETGHNSPFAGKPSIKSGVQSYLDSGVPAEKLILGMAFYGYYWKGCIEENTTNGLGVSVPRESRTVSMISYKEIGQKLKLAAWEQYWDDEAQCPYMYNPTEKSFISYTDVKEINLITAYAKKKELGGVMAWEYTQDNSTRELLNAMYSGILK